MRLTGYKKKMIAVAIILCFGFAACSPKEKEANKKQEQEAQITESAQEQAGAAEKGGNAGSVANGEQAGNAGDAEPDGAGTGDAGSDLPEMQLIAKGDFNGDGTEDSLSTKRIGEFGITKGLYVDFQSGAGEQVSVVPEAITISCFSESKTEFKITCGNLSLGTTTLAEEPAYGLLGKYLEKTLGMKKDGDRYDIEVVCNEVSVIAADNHKGSAILFKATLAVEEKLLDVTWTREYSLGNGKWMLTSVELPLWNITGNDTGWETTRAEWSEMEKRNLYMGYLDESDTYQNVDSKQDFDGDGTLDRIWRDLSDGESYSVHFGNGEKLLITDKFNGSHIECTVLQLTEEITVFWFLEAGMSTGGDWAKLYLFQQTEDGLVPMELPDGPTLRAEAVADREIAFYWNGQEPVGTLNLDSVDCFARLTTKKWLEDYTEEESGAYVFGLTGYDTCSLTEGSVPGRGAIRWNTYIGDKWGKAIFSWVTEYSGDSWKITEVFLP